MKSLENAAGGADFIQLVNQLYDIPEVQGFALDIDPAYVALLHGQKPKLPLNVAIERGERPAGWEQHCMARNLGRTTSPIRVIIYFSDDPAKLRQGQKLPNSIPPGHEVIIEQRGPFVAAADHAMHRPLVGGISVGNAARSDSGTLGGLLKQQGTSDPELLTCHHVLDDTRGADVLQRAIHDGGSLTTDLVGSISHNIPLKVRNGFGYSSNYNQVDACLAKIDTSLASVHSAIRLVGAAPTSIAAISSMSLGDSVVFVGKESDRQEAILTRFISRQKVEIDSIVHNFGDVFEIQAKHPITLARRGDSGSWVLTDVSPQASQLCGLLFAIDTSMSQCAFCCFIEHVLTELNCASGATYELY